MIRVQITNPEHPHYGDTGSLASKQTVYDGRVMIIKTTRCNHCLIDMEFRVEKSEIKVIRSESI